MSTTYLARDGRYTNTASRTTSTYLLLHRDPELNSAPVADGNVLGGDEIPTYDWSLSLVPSRCYLQSARVNRTCLCTLISTTAIHCWLYEHYGVLCLASHFMSFPGPTPRPRDLEQPLFSLWEMQVRDLIPIWWPRCGATMEGHRHDL